MLYQPQLEVISIQEAIATRFTRGTHKFSGTITDYSVRTLQLLDVVIIIFQFLCSFS